MATLDSMPLDYEKPDPMRYTRVCGVRHLAAIGMLLTGKADPNDAAVKQFIDFAKQQKMDISQCWAACHLDLIQASTLLVPSAGKTSMVFVSNVPTRKQIKPMSLLIKQASEAQDPACTRLIQALLEPHQQYEQLALKQAGFTHLANLIYMQRYVTPTNHADGKLQLSPNVQIYNWSENNRKRFGDAILASYEGTRDCPALLGVRPIEDIIDGHMAAGEFDPGRWFALYDGKTPLAVMLLNRITHRSALELVYLGVSPQARGQGLAKKLVQHAIDLTAMNNASQILLAVDQDNAPARKLYQQMGFTRGDKKTALIYLPPPEPPEAPEAPESSDG